VGLFDTLLGRTKPVRANLDALFSLPSAAITLQVTAGLVPTGRAGVCFKPPAGQPFAEMQAELEQLLATPDVTGASAAPASPTPGRSPAPATSATTPATPPPVVCHVGDKFGYRWIIVEATAVDDLVTRVHMVHSSLQDAGWSTQLLCSVFGFTPAPGGSTDAGSPATATTGGGTTPGEGGGAGDPTDSGSDVATRPLYLVYLAKRGTFYPFAPCGPEERDNELELRIRAVVADDLPVEADLSRWFPLWDLPIA
jgi:hypothetical protein